jgi:DNA repair exonuclease SbcCD ATPase subunit
MISKIFHLADLHIRKGNFVESRFTEYNDVFNNAVNDIKRLYVKDESICVICGDIFHHKLQISSHGIVLFYNIIHSLADIMPVIIIQGNHDLIQETDNENNDLIKALLDSQKHQNIHYYDKTGSFDFDNIHFGLVSIRDMLDKNTSCGLVEVLPQFPTTHSNKLNIALSHATVENSLLHNYTKTTSGVPIEWFKDYDALLLGDIHLQAVKYNKKHEIFYGYPGSLVQQDFGESIYNHGFLVWNIDENNKITTIDKFHVFNPVSRTCIKLINDEPYINAKDYIPFDDFLLMDDKPNDLHIRLYCKTNSSQVRESILYKLSQHNMNAHIDIVSANVLSNSSSEDGLMNVDLESLNSSNTIIEFFKLYGNKEILNKNELWENYFDNISTVLFNQYESLPEKIQNKLLDKNNKLNKCIENVSSTFNHKQNSLRITKISFDWILAFGNDNVFKFQNDQICLINAPNGYGKTAFYECICLGLFGEPIPSRYNKVSAVSILNKKKPKNTDSSRIDIDFTVNNVPYCIKRVFGDRDKSGVSRMQIVSVELYENGKLIKANARLVNAWVQDNICSINDFLLSTMITQNFDNDFFKLKVADQIALLDNVLHMDKINNICSVFKDSKKEYKDIKNHMDTYIDALKPTTDFDQEEYDKSMTSRQNNLDKLQLYKKQFEPLMSLDTKSFKLLDNLIKPEEELLDDLLKVHSGLNKQLNILNIDFVNQKFETHDLTIEQFIKDDFIGKPSSNVSFDNHLPINDLIQQLRKAHDDYDYQQYHINNLLSSKPTEVKETLEEYELFKNKLLKLKKKCKNMDTTVSEEPEDIAIDEKELNKNLLMKNNNELITIIQQAKHKSADGFEMNHDCWACRKNFSSSDSIDAQQIIDYREHVEAIHKWNTYIKNKKLIDELKDLETLEQKWIDLLPLIKQYNQWLLDHTAYTNKIISVKQNIINKQFVLQETYNFQIKNNKALDIQDELNKCLDKMKYFKNEKLKLQIKIQKCEQVEKDLLIQITTADISKNKQFEYEKNKVLLEEMIEFVTNKIELFTHFMDTFKKYKSWVYNDKLLPSIINRTNVLIDHIFKSRQLEVKFMFVDDNIIFTVIDEGNEINMEKLSGAQSFAVSLSFRLALSSTGISKFRCNQLFIDEGFCSFDQTNLVNVPELITNLKNLFGEIILVTHLQEIKSCADTVVNITRENGISKIMK